VGAGHAGRHAAGGQDSHPLGRDLQTPRERGGEGRADLDDRSLAPLRASGRDDRDRGDDTPDGGAHPNRPSRQRDGFDHLRDAARSLLVDQPDQEEPADEASDRGKKETQRGRQGFRADHDIARVEQEPGQPRGHSPEDDRSEGAEESRESGQKQETRVRVPPEEASETGPAGRRDRFDGLDGIRRAHARSGGTDMKGSIATGENSKVRGSRCAVRAGAARRTIAADISMPTRFPPARLLPLAAAAALFLAGIPAPAQQPYVTDDAEVTPRGEWHFQLANSFATLQKSDYPNLRQNTTNFVIQYGLAGGIEVNVDFPLIAIANSRSSGLSSVFGLGDVDL